LFNYAICVVLIFPYSLFETDLIRFVGSALTVLAAMLALQRIIAPMVLPSILYESRAVAS
jgi:hypothetical protein